MKPLISVIIPIYKVEEYLTQCIDSILVQTYSNLEVILVNDGSPDSSPEICDKYAIKDRRVNVLHRANGGLSDARNAGLKYATGEYIAFVDSDDWVDEDYIASLYHTAHTHDADIAVCNYSLYYGGMEIKSPKNTITTQKTMTRSDALKSLLIEQNIYDIVSWNKLYKSRLFKDSSIIFPIGKINEDNYTTYKLFDTSGKIAYTTSTLYYYRQRDDSIMSTLEGRLYIENIYNYTLETENYLLNRIPPSLMKSFKLISHYFILRQISIRNIEQADDYKKEALGALRSSILYTILSSNYTVSRKIKILLSIIRS